MDAVFDVRAGPLREALTVVATQDTDCTVTPLDDGGLRVSQRSVDGVSMAVVDLPGICTPVTGLPTEPFGIRMAPWIGALTAPTVRIALSDGRVRLESGRVGTVLPLYPVGDVPRAPRLEPTATAVVTSDDLMGLVRATPAKWSEAYRVAVSPDGVTVTAHDGTGLGVDLTVPAADCVSCDGSATAAYPWTRWADMLRSLPRGTLVGLSLSDDFPCRVDVSGDGWEGVWMVAPFIEEDGMG